MLVLIAWLLGESVLPGAVPHKSAALYWGVACATSALFFASLLAHELSHALVARRNGLTVRAITLWMLGGVAELDGEPPTAGADLRIAAVGPAVSAAAGGLFYGLAVALAYADGPAVITAALVWLGLMNGMLAVFNMLPGAPLDGGRVLRAVLWRHYRDRHRAEVAAARAGQFLGTAIAVFGVGYALWDLLGGVWLVLIGWFLVGAANAERQTANAAFALDGLRIADVMTADPQIAHGWDTVEDFASRVVAWSRQEVFPVVDFSGALVGVVVAGLLARVPPGQRAGTRLDRVALPVPPPYLAAPEDPARTVLSRPPLSGQVLAIVLDGDQITGIVTAGDLRQVVRRRLAALSPGARPKRTPKGVTRRGRRGHGVESI